MSYRILAASRGQAPLIVPTGKNILRWLLNLMPRR